MCVSLFRINGSLGEVYLLAVLGYHSETSETSFFGFFKSSSPPFCGCCSCFRHVCFGDCFGDCGKNSVRLSACPIVTLFWSSLFQFLVYTMAPLLLSYPWVESPFNTISRTHLLFLLDVGTGDNLWLLAESKILRLNYEICCI